jgi:hypothetical protein
VAYVMGQTTVPTGSVVSLFAVPSGLCNITFWNVSTNNIFIQAGTSATTVNLSTVSSLQCHSIPTNFSTYISSKGATFFGTCPTAGGATLNYIISTNQG